MIMKNKNEKVVIKGHFSQVSEADRRRMELSIQKAKKEGKFPTTAQNSIPYKVMYKNGICQLEGNKFSKTIEFKDVNYELKDDDDKQITFDKLCKLYNHFSDDMHIQHTYMNTKIPMEDIYKSIAIKGQEDGYNELRDELTEILLDKERRGNKGNRNFKYITYTIEERDPRLAYQKLKDCDADIQGILNESGIKADNEVLDGTQRLSSIHAAFHPMGKEKFKFNWSTLSKTGLSTKDFIAPMSFVFPTNGKYFRMGDIYGSVSLLSLDCAIIHDRVITDMLSMETPVIVSIHIDPIDKSKAKKLIDKKNYQINSAKAKQQTYASTHGYDMDLLPAELESNVDDTRKMLLELTQKNENLFNITILVTCFARSLKELQVVQVKLEKKAKKQSCDVKLLRDQQEQGLMSCIPLGINKVPIQRSIMTSQLAMLNPFKSSQLFEPNSIYYGINPLTDEIIQCDRTSLKNPNGLYLGVPGGGKSFAGKREILMYFLNSEYDIIIIDPEDEYSKMTEMLGGQVITISPTSQLHINPMDINFDVGFKDEDPIKTKCQFMLSIAEHIARKKASDVGLEGDELSLVDEITQNIYEELREEYWVKQHRNPTKDEMPILEDFYNKLLKHENPKAKRIADCFKIYVTGSLNLFNGHTNVDIDNRVVCFNTKDMSESLREFAMVIMTNFIWGRVSLNRNLSKKTILDIDEFHLMLKDEQTASYFIEFWKRFRKWGGVPSGLTQNVTDLLKSEKIGEIFKNSEFIYMLPQSKKDRDILIDSLGISEEEAKYITESSSGEGLIRYGKTIVPFKDQFPKGEIYKVLTTKPEEVNEFSTNYA